MLEVESTTMNPSNSRHKRLTMGQDKLVDSVAEHLPHLTRVVRGLTRCDTSVEDIVQQTVLKALTHADQFRFDSTLKTWLTSIAWNEVRQLRRSKWRARTVPLMDNVEGHRSGSREFRSASDGYEAKEREALVRQAVSHLPQAYRCVVELCDFQEIPLREVARKLSLSLAAVKSRRHRAKEKLLRLVKNLRQ